MDFLEKHNWLSKRGVLFTLIIVVTMLVGTLVEFLPLFFSTDVLIEKVSGVRPYTPLELAGRNIYVREGCYTCHSQMIRSLRDDVERYGFMSLAAESQYDHPFQWGSRRIGPDLARVGGKYTNQWHRVHLNNPQEIVPGSLMPRYDFLNRPLSHKDIGAHLSTLKLLGTPYTDEQILHAFDDLEAQAYGEMGGPDGAVVDLAALKARYGKVALGNFDGHPETITEMDALIAYLQILGTMVDLDKEAFFNVPQNVR